MGIRQDVNKGTLFAGIVLILIGIIFLLINFGLIGGEAFLIGLGIAFLLIYAFMPRRHWWPLIPGGILLFIGVMITLEDILPFTFGEFMAFFWPAILIVIGLWLVIRQFLKR